MTVGLMSHLLIQWLVKIKWWVIEQLCEEVLLLFDHCK